MEKNTKVFAFKLAQKAKSDGEKRQWKAREGVATAGCSLVELFPGFREPKCNTHIPDGGPWC